MLVILSLEPLFVLIVYFAPRRTLLAQVHLRFVSMHHHIFLHLGLLVVPFTRVTCIQPLLCLLVKPASCVTLNLAGQFLLVKLVSYHLSSLLALPNQFPPI